MKTTTNTNTNSLVLSLMKFASVIIAVISIRTSANANSYAEIFFAGWGPHNHDSVYYLPSKSAKQDFERYWKFKDLKRIFAACGYTYDVFKSNTLDPVKNIASVNIPCGSVVVDGGTYFGQMKPVWKALRNSRVGKVKYDTIRDSSQLEIWLKQKQESSQFLGYQFNSIGYNYKMIAEMPLQHDSTSPVKNDTVESFRKFYAQVIAKSNIRYEDIMWFKVCDDSSAQKDSSFSICNFGNVKIVKAISEAGYKIDTSRIGIIIKWYHK